MSERFYGMAALRQRASTCRKNKKGPRFAQPLCFFFKRAT